MSNELFASAYVLKRAEVNQPALGVFTVGDNFRPFAGTRTGGASGFALYTRLGLVL